MHVIKVLYLSLQSFEMGSIEQKKVWTEPGSHWVWTETGSYQVWTETGSYRAWTETGFCWVWTLTGSHYVHDETVSDVETQKLTSSWVKG